MSIQEQNSEFTDDEKNVEIDKIFGLKQKIKKLCLKIHEDNYFD